MGEEIKPLNEYTKEEILGRELLEKVFLQDDPVYQAQLIASLSMRAKELKCKGEFDGMVRAFRKAEKNKQRASDGNLTLIENWTNFSGGEYDNMRCRNWVAADDGIYKANADNGIMDVMACYHPILPIERLKNLETGEEQIKIAFKRNHKWTEIIVPKTMVTAASKIVSLSSRGIAVTSENARNLVKFLSDVENGNEDVIQIQYSSGKLGWIKDDNTFLPYDTNIVFDGDSRFGQLFESIKEHGSRQIWYDHIRQIRKTNRMEVKMLMAASFASVLVKVLGGLPFFVDLWGETEGGKSVTLMVAASIWANPSENAYIGDFKTTDTALEARADMLNNLPMMLDDTSKTSVRIRDNFEGIVYDLCSGKGKSRSNKELGINRENRWRSCFLTNGERPLNSYVQQGGAINRILEIECGDYIYKSPQETAELVKANYGFAGKDFVNVLKDIGVDEIRYIYKEFQKALQDDQKMQKQSQALSIVLTADKIATDYLFKDHEYIDLEEAKEVLTDRNELSDNERCYNYLLDKIAMNPARFDLETNIEKWGVIESGCSVFYMQAFDDLCRNGGFSKKSFLSWASRKGLVLCGNDGRPTKLKKAGGKVRRCVFLKMEDAEDADPIEKEGGFMEIQGAEQSEIPFD